jgi:DNA polymerase III delta subunit
MNISWDKPPLVMAIAGDDRFLRRRTLQHASMAAYQAGYEVIHAGSDSEVIAALSMTAAFGQPTLILVDGDKVDLETVKTHMADKPKQVCIAMEVDGSVDAKKHPAVALVKKKYLINYPIPARKADQESRAAKFLQMETHRLMSNPEALTADLALAMVGVLGADLGVLALEASKVTALVRSQGGKTITAKEVKAVVRGHTGVEMQPLRDALAAGQTKKVAQALIRIHRKSLSDPTMLLLRSRGGPADLAYQWLQVSLLLKRGKTSTEIATLVGSPSWRVERSLIPAAKRWGTRNLMILVRDLAHADRGVFRGVPSPWVACEAALLKGCCSVGG